MDKRGYKHNAEFLIVQVGPEYPSHIPWKCPNTTTGSTRNLELMSDNTRC